MSDVLIAAQAKKIFELEELVRAQTEVLEGIHMALVGMGGPLNDNVLGFNLTHRAFLAKIKMQIEDVLCDQN